MPFTKRNLSADELAHLDLAALSLDSRRIPPQDWDWAVDVERDVFCTLLVSNTHECREGDYWYLLLVCGEPSVFKVDAYSVATVNGHLAREATMERLTCSVIAVADLMRLAREGYRAVSVLGEDLLFLPA